ncbi:hypothetical protein BO79DRAFT_174869 [Aspergillus costaricaensis CBS 115574]|uniref:Uncharacterized protein n=1 Tax=Aspergillus costaricaensis CBS 115574 TaxID=1448317 RepID=A0ACD1IBZ0_9EURO|nr:hypothetical protein BO79DRAFT_174869 [Aspergillus costaricaensis CBS 115574]RAK87880.1 hypothetical protein BO79DRAFT_174869 [Aspergillus costaricaensis CBS 115574]
MPRLLSKANTVQRSSRPGMASSPSQEQKNRTVPQLSCVLCRDRKLKCDKLDPCSNCTSSGVACMPIYRPRLPRGRYGRPARSRTSSPSANESYGDFSNPKATSTTEYGGSSAPVDGLERLIPEGETNKMGPVEEGSALQELVSQVSKKIQSATDSTKNDLGTIVGDLSHHIRKLESLLQDSGADKVKINEANRIADAQENLQIGNTGGNTMLVQTTLGLETQQFPAIQTSSLARRCPEISGNDIWAEFTSNGMHDPSVATDLEPSPGRASDRGLKTNSLRRNSVNHGPSTLGMLSIGNSLSPSFMSLPRDKLGASKLCQVYLQNVDPIIKILHRPSLSKWMLDGASEYLESSEDDIPVRALESAICYVAANTMTEAHCQATFQRSKSTIMAVHRKLCEGAFEKAGLLTSRDMTVLQAFILYLIGRRSEDKDTAAWALVALAVRLARAMRLDQGPNDHPGARESFFQQQMRLRLWLTVCLVDIQASFAQRSEPLITHSGAACAIPNVAHVNDSDFDVNTEYSVASQEQLTDTTFALVTYHVQVAGRALNFGSPDCSTAAGRHKLSREVQQQVFTLLHYCDPESSPYAWFTWHSTQSIVSAIRLSELLPFRCSQTGRYDSLASPRLEGDTSLLRWSLQNLEKAHLLCTDPRGSGFRWYITIPCLALSTAIRECNICSDVETVRRAWPIIEASYRQHEELPSSHSCQLAQAHLVQMMNKTREKLSSLLQKNSNEFGAGQVVEVSATDPLVPMVAEEHTPIDPQLSGDMPISESIMPTASFTVSQPQLGHQSWNMATMPIDDVHARDDMLLTTDAYHSVQSDYF